MFMKTGVKVRLRHATLSRTLSYFLEIMALQEPSTVGPIKFFFNVVAVGGPYSLIYITTQSLISLFVHWK